MLLNTIDLEPLQTQLYVCVHAYVCIPSNTVVLSDSVCKIISLGAVQKVDLGTFHLECLMEKVWDASDLGSP